jgi:hypothetical protein
MQSGLKYIKLWEDRQPGILRLIELGMVDAAELGVKGLSLALLREGWPGVEFSWNRGTDFTRLRASRPDGGGVSYMGRTASNPIRYGLQGDWLWRSSDGDYQTLRFRNDVLDPDRAIKLAKDLVEGSRPFLDRVYGPSVNE